MVSYRNSKTYLFPSELNTNTRVVSTELGMSFLIDDINVTWFTSDLTFLSYVLFSIKQALLGITRVSIASPRSLKQSKVQTSHLNTTKHSGFALFPRLALFQIERVRFRQPRQRKHWSDFLRNGQRWRHRNVSTDWRMHPPSVCGHHGTDRVLWRGA